MKRALRSPEAAASPRLALAALGRSAALADVKKRLSQLAQSSAPLLLRGERGMRAAERRRIALEPGQPPQRSGVRRLQQERADQRVFRRARPIDLVAFRCSRRIGVGIKVGSQLRARNAGQSLDGYDMFCRNAFPGRNRGRGYFQCIRNRTNAPNSS